MRPVRLLIAAFLLLGLAGAVWYSEKHPPKPKDSETTKTEKIISTEQDKIQRVEIARTGADAVKLEKGDDGKWRITAPKPYKADESAVNSMLSNLASLNADQVVAEKNSDWAGYGLEPGKMKIDVALKDGKHYKLTLGEDAPTSSGVYARLEGDQRLFTIANYVKSSFDRPASDLRDKRVLPFDSEKASRVAVTTKDHTLEFGRAGNAWQIVKPKPMRADNNAVDDMVRAVRDANFESVLDESEKPPAKYSFSSPYATFEAFDPAGAHRLTIGKEGKDKDVTYYAKSSDMLGVFKISSSVAEALNKSVDALRNKKLFDFGWSDPQKLEVRDGDLRMTIEKKGDKWQRADAGNKELASDKVQSLIDNLRNMSAKAFTADDAVAQAKYGLSKPVAEARVTSDEGKRVEKVVIAAGPENKYYAARENEPATYEIERTTYEDFQKALQAVRDAPAAAAAPAPAKKK